MTTKIKGKRVRKAKINEVKQTYGGSNKRIFWKGKRLQRKEKEDRRNLRKKGLVYFCPT